MGAKAKRPIVNDFYSSSKRQFQTNCFAWLSFLFPDLRDAVDLGELDRGGFDLYCLTETGQYGKVYQCKGFEKVLAASQLMQCVASIKSFINAKSHTHI